MTLQIKFIKGEETFSFNFPDGCYSLSKLVKKIMENYKLKACLCKMILCKEKEGKFIYSDYNKNPDLDIHEEDGVKNFTLFFKESKKCYCKFTKYQLVHIIHDNENSISNLRNAIQANEQNINNLKKDNERLQKELNDLKAKKQDLEEKRKTNEQLLLEFKEMKKKVEENNKNEISNLKNDYDVKIDLLINQNKNEKNEILQEMSNLKNEHEKEIQNKNEEIDKLMEDNKKTENEKEQKLKEINILNDQYKEEIEKLNQEKENLKKEGALLGSVDPGKFKELKKLGLINNIEAKSNVIEIDSENRLKLNDNGQKDVILENFYDMIVDIKSIKNIDKGWELKMNEKGLKNYEKFKKQKVIKIGIIGNSNKGKSFILSKLSQISLPSGADIKTEGLSIKYPELEGHENRNIVLLDSAGLETPVLNNEIEEYIQEKEQNEQKIEFNTINNENDENEKDQEKNNSINKSQKIESNDLCEKVFKEKSREKIMTELFLQNYIMHNSDILILVVGILTYSEQKLINRIKTEMKNQKIEKPLYIIHNLVLYDTVEKVEKHIKDNLMKCATFKLEKKEKIGVGKYVEKGYHFYEKNYKPAIYHLIMANDLSDAGSVFNPYTINFILNNFEHLTDLKSYDVIETLKERLVSLSNDYFENPISIDELYDNETIFKNKKISLKEKNNDINSSEIKSDENNLDKNKSKKNGIQLKCCLIDELGFSNFKGNGFIPKYNWFENGEQICLRIEVPGNVNIQCQQIRYSGEYTIIPITGEKKKDSTPKRIEDNIYTTREFGNFEVKIYLPTEKYSVKNEEYKAKHVNGVAVFNFNLEKKEISNEITTFDEL